jgi:GT2 family glycosyltransferase
MGTEVEEQNPLVSIVVRTKDRPKFVKKALESISAQTYRPIEVVLVNDGGCSLNVSEIKGILKDVSLKYINFRKNKGRAHAGNVGIENAKGDYVGFLDDDDEFYPDHVSTLTSFLLKNDYQVAYTLSELVKVSFDSDDEEKDGVEVTDLSIFLRDFSKEILLIENYIPFNTLLIKRDIFREIGGIDEELELYEDWDLLIRISEKYPFYFIPQATSRYRYWSKDKQITAVKGLAKDPYLKVVGKHINKINPEVLYSAYFLSHERKEYNKEVLTQHKRIISDLQHNVLQHQKRTLADLKREVEEKDRIIKDLQQHLEEKDRLVKDHQFIIMGRDRAIKDLQHNVEEKDRIMKDLQHNMQEQHKRIIRYLQNNVDEKDRIIQDLQLKAEEKGRKAKDLQYSLGDKERTVMDLLQVSADKDTIISGLQQNAEEQNNVLKGLQDNIAGKDSFIKHILHNMEEMREKNENLNTRLDAIYQTLGWRLLNRIRELRDIILPVSTRRGRMYAICTKSTRSIINEGWRSFFTKTKRRLRKDYFTKGFIRERKHHDKRLHEEFHYFQKRHVDIILPVYNGVDFLDPCINSVLENTDLTFNNLIIIDDNSTDSRVRDILQRLTNDHDGKNITIILNDINYGFVKTANMGMKMSDRDDVIMLNADTVVTKNWLNKLQKAAYLSPDIATVTPFSNNATICSIPRFDEINEIPPSFTVQSFGEFIENISLRYYPEIPTAIGFCMYMKRSAIRKVGFFDEKNFGKGYGEENDFCMKAMKMGYKNILDDSTFIYHKGGLSFSSTKKTKLVPKAVEKLDSIHPEYLPMVTRFINENPLKPIHDYINLRLSLTKKTLSVK